MSTLESPKQHLWSIATKNADDYIGRADQAWGHKGKTLWLELERDLVDLLSDEGVAETDKVYLAKWLLNAYTGRGHFHG